MSSACFIRHSDSLYATGELEISRGMEKEMAWEKRVEIKIAIFLSDLGPFT